MSKAFFLITTWCAFTACNSVKQPINEMKDSLLTIQVAKIANNGSGQLAYQVRVIPSIAIKSELNSGNKHDMLYQMDSCFYLQNNKQKIYAVNTQAVANGLADVYEYMVVFGSAIPFDKNWQFIYQDKYLDHKKYTLKIEN